MKNLLYIFCFIGYFAHSQNIENVRAEYEELTMLKELISERLKSLEINNPSLKENKDEDFFKHSHDIIIKEAENVISKDIFENIENLQKQIMESEVTNSINSLILNKMKEYKLKLETEIKTLPSKR